MSTERWVRVKQVTSDVLERAESERAEFLAEACAGDETLRREVESLLIAHERAGDFLEAPCLVGTGAAEAVASLAEGGSAPVAAGQGVGPYRVVRELGRGGMGVVYLAERADAAFEKQVAVKVVRGGLGSETSLERFREERRILATLDHPNIARLLDGGTIEEGLPYFVMEYVDGIPLDVYAASIPLSPRERLLLFQQVCSSVQYAHQRLVIHRDLKAQNILVTSNGTPKLLDFGIAKLLEPGPEQQARTGTRLLSLEGASPEQVRGEPLTVTSDVYSLGVLLYRLLAGQGPYGAERRTDADLIRAICEEVPPRPSAVAPTERRRSLRGELDCIVLKALRKEPDRRYASVEQLSDDIGRYLTSRPVLAAPDTLRYRAAKFVRRHAVAVASAALVVLSVAGGFVATARQARIAEGNHHRAERRFAQVRALARAFIFDVHDSIRELEGSTKARESIVKRGLEYLDSLAEEADDPSLLDEVAAGYERIGEVQGDPQDANLGDLAGAVLSWRKALALREGVFRSRPGSIDAAVKLALGHCRLASGLVWAGRSTEAVETARRAWGLLEPLPIDGKDTAHLLEVGQAWSRIGDSLRLGGDIAAAIEAFQKGQALAERAYDADPATAVAAGGLIRAQIGVSDALIQRGRRDEALTGLRSVHEIAARLSGADPSNGQKKYGLLILGDRIGDQLDNRGDVDAAIEVRQGNLALAEALVAADSRDARARFARFVCYYKLGIALRLKKDWKGAVHSEDRAVALAEPEVAADPRNTWTRHLMAGAYLERGEALEGGGSPAAALASYRTALEIDQALADQDPKNAEYVESLADTRVRLARCLTASGDPRQAISTLETALALLEPLAAAEPTNTRRKSTLASVNAGLGAAWARLAARGRESCAAYGRSAALWKEYEALSSLDVTDAAVAATSAREAERCSASRAAH